MKINYARIINLLLYSLVIVIISCQVSSTDTSQSTTKKKENPSIKDPEVDRDMLIELLAGNGFVVDKDKDTILVPRFNVKFSKDIDLSNLQSAVFLTSNDNPNQHISLNLSNQGSSDSIILYPSLALATTTVYNLHISSQVKTLEGKIVPDTIFSFTTGDDNKLIATLTDPVDVENILESPKLQLHFNHRIYGFNEHNAIVITDAINRTAPPINILSITPNPQNDELTIKINDTLLVNTKYNVLISDAIKDEHATKTLNSTLHFITKNSTSITCSLDSTKSNILVFKPKIAISCDTAKFNTSIASNILEKNVSIYYTDNYGTRLNIPLYLINNSTDGLFIFSIKTSFDPDKNYFLHINKTPFNNDKQINSSTFAIQPNLGWILKAPTFSNDNRRPNTIATGMTLSTSDTETSSAEILVYGNLNNNKGIFFDKYNNTGKITDSSELLINPSDASFIKLQDYIPNIKNNNYLLLNTNLGTDLKTLNKKGNSSIYSQPLLMVKPLDRNNSQQNIATILSDGDDVVNNPATARSMAVSPADNGILVYILSELKQSSSKSVSCIVSVLSLTKDGNIITLNKLAESTLANVPDSAGTACDKIFLTDTNLQEFAISYTQPDFKISSQSYQRSIQIFQYDSGSHNISSKRIVNVETNLTSWDGGKPVMSYQAAEHSIYLPAIADNETSFKMFKCDTRENPSDTKILFCTVDSDIGNKGDAVAKVNSLYNFFDLDRSEDRHSLLSYKSRNDYMFADVELTDPDKISSGVYHLNSSDPKLLDKSKLLKYIHDSGCYDYFLWNYANESIEYYYLQRI